jgi:hypothetical protein
MNSIAFTRRITSAIQTIVAQMRGTVPIGSLHGKLLMLLRLVKPSMGQGHSQRIPLLSSLN